MPSPDLTEVAERPAVSGKAQAKFLTGSTMRHVVVMTLTGSLGL